MYMYNQLVLFVESVVAVDDDDVRLIELACCNNSTNFVLSTVVEPNSACATSGIIWIVIIGTVDDDADDASVVEFERVSGATVNRS